MTLLQMTMNRWLREAPQWGLSDCCMSCGDWVSQVRGGDLMADLRWAYDDFASAQRVTRFFTQPLEVVGNRLDVVAGLARVSRPQRGDVALFKWPRPDGRVLPIGGICVVPGLIACRPDPASRAPGIVEARPAELIAAWAVGYSENA